MLSKEPAAIIGGIVAILNAIQISAISMPEWAHTLIAVITVALGALVTRSQVTPVKATAMITASGEYDADDPDPEKWRAEHYNPDAMKVEEIHADR